MFTSSSLFLVRYHRVWSETTGNVVVFIVFFTSNSSSIKCMPAVARRVEACMDEYSWFLKTYIPWVWFWATSRIWLQPVFQLKSLWTSKPSDEIKTPESGKVMNFTVKPRKTAFLFNVACALIVVIFLVFSPLHARSHTYSFVIGSKHKERSAREHVSQTSCHPNDDKLAASPLASQSSPDLAFMRAQFLKMEIDGTQVKLKVAGFSHMKSALCRCHVDVWAA